MRSLLHTGDVKGTVVIITISRVLVTYARALVSWTHTHAPTKWQPLPHPEHLPKAAPYARTQLRSFPQ